MIDTSPSRRTILDSAPPEQRATMWVAHALLVLELLLLVGMLVTTFGSLALARPIVGLAPTNSLQVTIAAFFILPAAVLALIGVIGLFLMRTIGWASAMLTQALLLSGSLIYYFRSTEHPLLLFGLMLYGIVMVLYLNSANFRAQFHGVSVSTDPQP